MLTDWGQDLVYAFRRLFKASGFTAVAVLSIGLGIAANTTIFSLVSRFLLRSAPVGDPGTLVSLYTTQRGDCCSDFSWLLYADVRDQATSFSGVTAYFPMMPASIGGHGEPERVWGELATANFFAVAQLRMTLGRGFLRDEEQLPVMVLSHRLWQRRFGGDPRIAGKAVLLSGRPFTVVGVAPPGFRGLDILDSDLWVPLGNKETLMPKMGARSRTNTWLQVAGRLKPGVDRRQATAELDALGGRLASSYPDAEKERGFRLEPAGSLPPREKPAVAMFLAALTAIVLLVLAIACANVANLLLAQASVRQREMALRLALGATRRRLVRQVLTESMLLSLGGGLFGITLTLWATAALSAFRLPLPVPIDLRVAVDGRVLLYAFALSVGTGLVFGSATAWAAGRQAFSKALRGEEALGRPGRRFPLRNLLVISQIATSLVLLCAAGLFLHSLWSASGIDVGFRSRGILMMAIDPEIHGYTSARTTQLLSELRRRVATLPGVAAAAATDNVPLSLGGRRDGFHPEGSPPAEADPLVDLYMVTAGYFDTLGIPRLAGRDFVAEGAAAPKVAVVNEAFARRLFQGGNALGRRVTGGGATYEIVGVVGNSKSRTLGEEPRPILYRSLEQNVGADPDFMGYSLLVRSNQGGPPPVRAVRDEIRAQDPALAVFNVQTMEEHLRDARFLPRLAGTLFGLFGFVGLLLAGIGLYGVMSYSVSRRTREIGIRLAVGARRGGIQSLVLREGMLLTAIALSLGLAAALAVAKLAGALLYGVRPHDPVTFTAVPLFLAAVAFLACWLPSRRAARVDPLVALREE